MELHMNFLPKSFRAPEFLGLLAAIVGPQVIKYLSSSKTQSRRPRRRR